MVSSGPIVKVRDGLLLGKMENTDSGTTYFAFRGIPYAKPPVGSLRFKVSGCTDGVQHM